MKLLLTIFLLQILSGIAEAQVPDSCVRRNQEIASADIKKGKPQLLLISGFAAKYYPNDLNFAKKYKITFHDFGCIADKEECMLAYNQTIFHHLDKTYGSGWRKEVRQDIYGLHPARKIK